MNQRYIATSDLETLAGALFNGGMAPLPLDPNKRRVALAREFARAHVEIPGVTRRDVVKFAALGTPYKAIAAARQVRVDEFLAALVPKPSVENVRQKLVAALGEQALQIKVFNWRHSIAAAMILLDRLDGKAGTQLDLRHADAAKFAAKLDAAIPGARQKFYPSGNVSHPLRGLSLLSELAEALAATPARPAAAPKPAAPKPTRVTRESLAAAIRAEPDAHIRAALYQHFTSIAEKP
jgi:hypothetical protein